MDRWTGSARFGQVRSDPEPGQDHRVKTRAIVHSSTAARCARIRQLALTPPSCAALSSAAYSTRRLSRRRHMRRPRQRSSLNAAALTPPSCTALGSKAHSINAAALSPPPHDALSSVAYSTWRLSCHRYTCRPRRGSLLDAAALALPRHKPLTALISTTANNQSSYPAHTGYPISFF